MQNIKTPNPSKSTDLKDDYVKNLLENQELNPGEKLSRLSIGSPDYLLWQLVIHKGNAALITDFLSFLSASLGTHNFAELLLTFLQDQSSLP